MSEFQNNPKRDWLMRVVSAAIPQSYQECRYKAEHMLAICDEQEAELEDYNQTAEE